MKMKYPLDKAGVSLVVGGLIDIAAALESGKISIVDIDRREGEPVIVRDNWTAEYEQILTIKFHHNKG